jgi:hypothetical protein
LGIGEKKPVETLSASASVKEARPSSSGTFTPDHPIHLVSKFCFTPATINQSIVLPISQWSDAQCVVALYKRKQARCAKFVVQGCK